MSKLTKATLSPDTQAMLDCLQLAVNKTLERKRRLGQYVVQWDGKEPFAIGEDAPEELKPVLSDSASSSEVPPS
ncbi:hypothetical protein A1507_19125 [Methylomonas koyamae]|uniref:Uncharacterized protein n=1 Tax=Methylomonas koyamae TaxID=702114 RepID=A0A177N370_9GAMM|nr:hypothetical protein [Methylomonas koyamae]OAI12104.1 hypothetical protein A1507_19125 [Methylomonas koyamae]